MGIGDVLRVFVPPKSRKNSSARLLRFQVKGCCAYIGGALKDVKGHDDFFAVYDWQNS